MTAVKSANLKRLRRIEGQIRGLHRMVETDRPCPEIIIQVASAQQALRGVARELMRNHLRHCANFGTDDELLDLIYKHLR